MRTPLAWKNVAHNKVRAATSLAGVSFAILLIFMQLGFYDACFRSSTMVFDQLDFDIVLMSPQYVHLRASGSVPRGRIYQARGVEGVEHAVPFYIATSTWRNPQTQDLREMLVLAITPRDHFLKLDEAAKAAHLLTKDDTVLVDSKAQKSYGVAPVGTLTDLENREVEVVGTYGYGSGFISDAAVIVSDRTLIQLVPGTQLESVSLGLVKVKEGEDVRKVVQALKDRFADDPTLSEEQRDVQVWRRDQLEVHEQRYFVREKPLGIMFFSGVLLALVVGAVILYQILSSEISNRLKEYATLKAMGYSNNYMRGVVLQQASIFALFGYIPAVVLSLALYAATKYMTNLPMTMTWQRLLLVLALSIGMCGVSGLLVSRKVSNADPADLF